MKQFTIKRNSDAADTNEILGSFTKLFVVVALMFLKIFFFPLTVVPFVRVSLVVAGKHIKTKKSSRKRNTIDPVWGETIR